MIQRRWRSDAELSISLLHGLAVAAAVVGFLNPLLATAASPTGSEALAAADAELLADRPLAAWRFEDPTGAKQATAERFSLNDPEAFPNDTGSAEPLNVGDLLASVTPLPARMGGTVVFAEAGPRPPRHQAFAATNLAALFGGGRSFLTVPTDTSRFDDFRFEGGDSITLEAWVNAFGIDDGQQVYLIGKGRTNRKEAQPDNQNWALRLAGRAGVAAPSFLFRSAGEPGGSGSFHRWTATEGFVPSTGWHHVAITYTFGEKDSLRGYLDGRPVTGAWDLGGATTAAPVTDDDEVWIGSSLGGNQASTFVGLLDNVAIHRRVLPPDRIAARWQVDETVPAFDEVELSPVPDQLVLFELIEDVADVSGWRFPLREPSESFTRRTFALIDLPHHYNVGGLRADRQLPLIVRARGKVMLPPGPQRIRVRARGEARVLLDGEQIATLKAPGQRTDGHEKMFVPDLSGPAGMRFVQVGDQQAIIDIEGDGEWHTLHVEVKVGSRNRRPELGEFCVSVGPPDAVPMVFTLGDGADRTPLTDAGWAGLAEQLAADTEAANTTARRAAAARQLDLWERRHAETRSFVAASPGPAVPRLPADQADLAAATFNEIDSFVNARLVEAGVSPAALADDEVFIRRLSLDVRGIIPSPEEIEQFLADASPERRQRLIDRFLADPRWADHWVPFWQDLLGENPNLVNPTLNNTGPFRFWIHESFLDRKPLDRFVTELIMMEGSKHYGGPAGFGLATENDVPMAEKAAVIGRTFLGIEMACARCHDAPTGDVMQEDLFSLAAMLKRAPEKVPASSSVPVSPERLAQMAISVTLKPGSTVGPAWPFTELLPDDAATDNDSRARLAALVTAPANPRFAKVLMNRLWARYFGSGLVDDLNNWEGEEPTHPELLDWLARRFVLEGYRLERMAGLIFASHTYGRGMPVGAAATLQKPFLFAGRGPRRVTAEQLSIRLPWPAESHLTSSR